MSAQTRLYESLTVADANKAVVRAQILSVVGGRKVVSSAEGYRKIFKSDSGIAKRVIQNVGLHAVYIYIGEVLEDSTPNLKDGQAHFILAPGIAALDGKGGVIDLSWFAGDVWAVTADDASEVCYYEAFGSDRLPNQKAEATL